MNIKNLLAELQKDYLNTFQEKIENLKTLYAQGKLEELKTEYHKLKGTGRTYGLPEVTQLGDALEVLCEHPDALQIAVPISATVLAKIRDERKKGEILDMDLDRDFQVIVELVLELRRIA